MLDDAANDYLRVAGYSIALFDMIQTVPAAWRLYRDAWTTWKLLIIALLFAVARYLTAVSLITGAAAAFGSSFTAQECSRLHLVPAITQLIATWATQGIVVVRTYSISKRSNAILLILGLIGFFGFFLQTFGTLYKRNAVVEDGKCSSQVHTQWGYYESGTLYFAASLVYYGVATLLSIVYVYAQTMSSPLSSFTRTLAGHGVHLIATLAFVNLLCLLASMNMDGIRNLGWTLPNAISLIMAQHLAIMVFDVTSWGRVERPTHSRGVDDHEQAPRRSKSSQIELRGIKVQRETITQTELDDEEHQRTVRVGRRHSSITEWQSQADEKGRPPSSHVSEDLGPTVTPTSQYALKFAVTE